MAVFGFAAAFGLGLTLVFLIGADLVLTVVVVVVLVLGLGFTFAFLLELVAERAPATAFLMPALSAFDAGLRILLLLLRRDVEDSSRTFSCFRFLPATVFGAGFFLGYLDSLEFSCFSLRDLFESLGLGPSTPRHVGAPQRHCCTFF